MDGSDSPASFSTPPLLGWLVDTSPSRRYGGLPSPCTLFSVHATPFVNPGCSPQPHHNGCFVVGFKSIADCRRAQAFIYVVGAITGLQGGADSPVAYTVPCVRFSYVVQLAYFFAPFFITATLGKSGWLTLTLRGLAPRKERQVSLGAHDWLGF
jgi:hypothetical protein